MRKTIVLAVVFFLIFSSASVGFVAAQENSDSYQLSNSNEEESRRLNIGVKTVGTPYEEADEEKCFEKIGDTDPKPGEHEFSNGTEITVTASSEDNWKFSHWTGDISGELSEQKEINITMTSDKELTANFRILEEKEYLGTDKESYEPGEEVIVEVKNDGSATYIPIINFFRIQIQKLDTGEVVHVSWNDETGLPMEPEYGKTEHFVWDQTCPDGEQVPEGNYVVKSEYEEIFNHTAEFQISEKSPELEVSELKVEPEKPSKGEEVDLTVEATNTGDEYIEYTFDFNVDVPCRVSFNLSETVTIGPGETENITTNFTAIESGEYKLEIDGFEKTTFDLEVKERNFLADTWWLMVMVGFVIAIMIGIPLYDKKRRDMK